MCRLLVYSGTSAVSLADLLVNPSHSITKQSYSCRERFGDGLSGLPPALNADGFGIGWYDHDAVARASSSAGAASADTDAAPVTAAAAAASGCCGAPLPATLCGTKRRRGEGGCGSDAGGERTAPTAAGEAPAAVQPGVYTSTSPAWNDVNLPRLCDKLSSRLVFAHIRAASLGTGVHIMNCHPFAASRYLWMHNGHIGGFSRLRRRILLHLSDRALAAIRGTTDSEALFGVFLTEVEAVEGVPHARLPPSTLADCLLRAFNRIAAWREEAGIEDSSLLNVCVSDGATVLASRCVLGTGRPASLYFTAGSRWAPRDATAGCPPGGASRPGAATDYAMSQSDRRNQAVIIASERLTSCEDDWLPVPPDTLLVVHPSVAILRVPITLSAAAGAVPLVVAPPPAPLLSSSSFDTVVPPPPAPGSPRTATDSVGSDGGGSSDEAASDGVVGGRRLRLRHTPPPLLAAGTTGIYIAPGVVADLGSGGDDGVAGRAKLQLLGVAARATVAEPPPPSSPLVSGAAGRPQMGCTGRDIAAVTMSSLADATDRAPPATTPHRSGGAPLVAPDDGLLASDAAQPFSYDGAAALAAAGAGTARPVLTCEWSAVARAGSGGGDDDDGAAAPLLSCRCMSAPSLLQLTEDTFGDGAPRVAPSRA